MSGDGFLDGMDMVLIEKAVIARLREAVRQANREVRLVTDYPSGALPLITAAEDVVKAVDEYPKRIIAYASRILDNLNEEARWGDALRKEPS